MIPEEKVFAIGDSFNIIVSQKGSFFKLLANFKQCNSK